MSVICTFSARCLALLSVLLLLAPPLSAHQFPLSLTSAPAVKSEGSYIVYVQQGDAWLKAGSLSCDRFFREQRISLGKLTTGTDPVRIRLEQQGGGPAHIDSVFLGQQGPVTVKGTDDPLALQKLSKTDFDVIDAHDRTIDLVFTAAAPDPTLCLTARIEGDRITDIPFHYPIRNLYRTMNADSAFYTYRLDDTKLAASSADGRLNANGTPFFKEWSETGTGHPSGYTYGWVANDDRNLYVKLDFTPDDTMDGTSDYATVYVKTGDQLREFRLTTAETRWGIADFTYTDKVPYQHKVYDFTIPLRELGIAEATRTHAVELAFAAYGTAAPGLSESVTVNPVTNKIYVANGTSSIVTVINGATGAATQVVTGGSVPIALAVNPATNRVYVANQDSGTVTVIDGTTDTVADTVTVGSGPTAIAINPATNRIYVANTYDSTVTMIDGSTNSTTPVSVGSGPFAIAVNPATDMAYVANSADGTVSVIDGAGNAVATVTAGSYPRAIAVNPATNKIYVANNYGSSVTVIDGTANTTTSVTVGNGPSSIAVNPATNSIYVANYYDNSVTVIDGVSDAVTATVAAAANPIAVAVDFTADRIYVAGINGTVTVIDAGSNSVSSTIACGTNLRSIAVNPVTNRAYVASYNSNSIIVIDRTANAAGAVNVGMYPVAVAINPVTNMTYVANSDSGTVSVIGGTTNAAATVATGSQPLAVAVNQVTNKVYVANEGDDTVTVIDGTHNDTAHTTTTATGVSPQAIAVNPVTNKIYVANYGSNTVTVINGATDTPLPSPITVGTKPCAIAINSVTNKVYVVNYVGASSTGSVTVIDGTTDTVLTTVTVGKAPRAIAVNSLTDTIYVANSGSGTSVTVIDGASNTTGNVTAGSAPWAVAVNQVTNRIYVANKSGNSVTIIDGAYNNDDHRTTLSLSGTGTTPYALAVNPASNRIYVANSGSDNVVVIDGVTNTFGSVPAGTQPQSLAVNQLTGRVYVANVGEVGYASTVTVIGEQAELPIPLTVAISPLTGNVSASPTPDFSFLAASAFAPTAPPVRKVYYQFDTRQGAWKEATAFTGSTGTVTDATPLPKGNHVLYLFATDGQDATSTNTGTQSSPLVGSIAAYALTVKPDSPSVATAAADALSQTGATLNGTVNGNGADTIVTFEYGTTASYGSSAPGGTVSGGSGIVSISAVVSGLACGTTYHFRASAQNSAGAGNGDDQMFATAACSHTISTAVTGGNGTITCTTPITQGNSSTCTITPDPGFRLATLADNGADVLASVSGTTYTIVNVIAPHTVTAGFVPLLSQSIAAFAPPATIVYGDLPVTLSATATSGLTVNFSVTGGPGSISGTTLTITGAGTISLRASQPGNTSYAPAADVTASVTAVARPLTVTADSLSKVYGTADPPLTYQITSGTLAAGDALHGALTRTAGENAGSYAIAQGTLTAGPNYNLSYVTASLSVTRRPLTIIAGSASRPYGAPNPVLDNFTVSGLAGGDTITGVATTFPATATPTADVGTSHAITPSAAVFGVGSADNYSINYMPGTLTIDGQASQSITGFVPPSTAVYGGAPLTISAAATSGLPVSFSVVSGPGSINGNQLSVTGAGIIVVRASQSGDLNHLPAADVTASITVTKATATIALSNLAQIFNGAAKSVVAATTPPGLATLVTYDGSMAAPVAAGSYSIVAVVSGANYQGSATGTLVIAKALPVITWPPPATVYVDSVLSSTHLNATASVPGTFSYVPPAGTVMNSVGSQSLAVTFTPADTANYSTATATVTLTVSDRQIPAITWTAPAALSYGTLLSTAQLNASASVPGTFSYDPPAGTLLNAGTRILTVTFTPADTATYAATTASVTLTVNKAPALVTLTGLNQTYDGTAKAVTANTTPVGRTVVITYSGSTAPPATAGNYPVIATITDANYQGSATSTLLIAPAQPVITWPAPAMVYVGTSLSPVQLNAAASIPGTFTYTPAAGTVMNSVGSQPLAVTFTPADGANYTAATATVSLLVISKQVPAITWHTPAAVGYGTQLSASQLNATAGIPGTFSYDPPLGTVLNAGSRTLSVSFTPDDTATYTAATASITLTVNKAQGTVTLTNLSQIYDGMPKTITATTIPAGLAVAITYNGSDAVPVNAGSYTVAVTLNDANYSGTASGSLTIAKAVPAVSWPSPAPIVYGTPLSALQLNASASIPGTFAYAPAAGTLLPAGNRTLTATFAPGDSANYDSVTATVPLTINTLPPVIITGSMAQVATASDGSVPYPLEITSTKSKVTILSGTRMFDADENVVIGLLSTSALPIDSTAALPPLAVAAPSSDGRKLISLGAAIEIVISNGTFPVKTIMPPLAVSLAIDPAFAAPGTTVEYFSFDGSRWTPEGTAIVNSDGRVDLPVGHLSIWAVAKFEVPSGDLNGDGTVTIVDALLALQVAVGIRSATPAQSAAGDVAPLVDGRPAPNGAINVGDALVILQKAVGVYGW